MVTAMEPTARISVTKAAPLSRSAIGEAKREQYEEYHLFHILNFYCYNL